MFTTFQTYKSIKIQNFYESYFELATQIFEDTKSEFKKFKTDKNF